ncbi:hypothetical protein KKA14_22340, partial [bacterium]|nr:hypothetical protein [bacterium]
VTFAPGGHASKIYVSNTYTWQNGDIYLMKSIKQDWDIKKELYVRIIMKRTDGEMAVDDFSVLTEDEVELDQK